MNKGFQKITTIACDSINTSSQAIENKLYFDEYKEEKYCYENLI